MLSISHSGQRGAKYGATATDELAVDRFANGIVDRNPSNIKCILTRLRFARNRHNEHERDRVLSFVNKPTRKGEIFGDRRWNNAVGQTGKGQGPKIFLKVAAG